jgi:hypothetical protein
MRKQMVRFAFISLLFMAVVPFAAVSPGRDEHARFLAGYMILKSNHTLTPVQKQQYFKELQALTGVTVEMSRNYIFTFRNRPAAWKEVQELVQKIIDEEHGADSTKVSSPAPVLPSANNRSRKTTQ